MIKEVKMLIGRGFINEDSVMLTYTVKVPYTDIDLTAYACNSVHLVNMYVSNIIIHNSPV